ncbi:hypothetical protein [Marinicrinis lubricantis]|uniref:Uncharacterized protein n=1 Tax=Marinicrinis lubricantis TaxID=2086470 RepID=A0ABW1ISY1_9BACL
MRVENTHTWWSIGGNGPYPKIYCNKISTGNYAQTLRSSAGDAIRKAARNDAEWHLDLFVDGIEETLEPAFETVRRLHQSLLTAIQLYQIPLK